MNITELRTSISDMTNEEIASTIRELRKDRRKSNVKIKVRLTGFLEKVFGG